MAVEVEIAVEADAWTALDGVQALSRDAVAAALGAALGAGRGRSVSVLLTSDAAMAALNARFRGKPEATNVLSWPVEDLAADEDGGAPDAPGPAAADGDEAESLGDLALAFETVEREAQARGLPVGAHVFHLIVHGTLHLLGYDHVRDGDAERMEALESRICLAAGLDDPYVADIEDAPRPHAAAGSERGHGR